MASSRDEVLQDTLDREGLTLAPLDRRSYAFLIDALLLSVLVIMINLNTFLALSEPQTLQEIHNSNSSAIMLKDSVKAQSLGQNIEQKIQKQISSLIVQIFLLEIIYQGLFTFWYGASLGKIVCKIQVINIDLLDSPSFLASFLRATLRTFSQAAYYIPFIFAFSDAFKRTLYDRATRTIVIMQKS